MMTREEAIINLQVLLTMADNGRWDTTDATEAVKVAISALRPVSRERVEKVWRGEWIGMTDDDGCTWQECSRCEHDLDNLEEAQNFCPACGAPMTDEAVQMVVERLEALHGEKESD